MKKAALLLFSLFILLPIKSDSQAISVITPIATGSTDVQVLSATTARVRLCGVSVKETTGVTAASVIFHSGTSVAGPVILEINLLPNETTMRGTFGCTSGPSAGSGVFINRTGDLSLTIYSQRF